jgi:hypothetical protein
MDFTPLSQERTRRTFRRLADPCVVTPEGGDAIETRGIFEKRTAVVGDLGPLLDERPSIEFMRADIGALRRATVTILGRTFDIDRPVDLALNADDDILVRYYLRERKDG